MFAGVGGLGIAEALTYFASKETPAPSPALSAAIVIGIAQSVVLCVLGYLLMPVLLAGHGQDTLMAGRVYLLVIPLNLILTLYPSALLQARLSAVAFNVGRMTVHIAYTAILLAIWSQRDITVLDATWASLAANCFTAAVIWPFVVRQGHFLSAPSLSKVKELLAFGAQMHVGNIASVVVGRLDLIALSLLGQPSALGLYVAASSVGAIAQLLPTAASLVLYPRLAAATALRRRTLLKRLFLVGGLATAVSLPVSLVIAPPAMQILFGAKFDGLQNIVRLLLLASVLRGWALILTVNLRASGLPLRASVTEWIGAIIFACVLLIAVPPFGAAGAAIASLIASGVVFLLLIRRSICPNSGVSRQYAE